MTNVSVVLVTSGTKGGKMRWEQKNMLFLNCSVDFFYSGSSSQFNLSKSLSIWFALNIEHLWYSLLCIFATQVSVLDLSCGQMGFFCFSFFIGSGVRELPRATFGTLRFTWIHFCHCNVRVKAYSLFSYSNCMIKVMLIKMF